MNLNDLASSKVAILGMGIEGVALAEFLQEKCRSITLLDRKTKEELLAFNSSIGQFISRPDYHYTFGEDYLIGLNDYDVIFRSPGIKYLTPEIQAAKQADVIISSQIKLFFDLCPSKIIGVTGTKGKGTTSSLIYEIMKKNSEIRMSESESTGNTYLAGNIGVPAVTLLPMLTEDDIVILELSSFQLQDLHKSPYLAVILNVSSDHLDYHSGNGEYLEAKANIVKYQSENDIVVVNRDYPKSIEISKRSLASQYHFSGIKIESDGAYVRQNNHNIAEVILNIGDKEEIICNEKEIQLFGKHNLENIAAASLSAKLAGAELDAIKQAVKDFKGLPHRLEYIADIEGIKVFNDSFSTNPEPTIAAVKAFNQPKLLILGGSTKGAEFNEMARVIADANVRAVAVIGDEAERIADAISGLDYSGNIISAGYDLLKAINGLFTIGQAGDVLLFSPACASFDMFKNYKDRGEKFKAAISALNDKFLISNL